MDGDDLLCAACGGRVGDARCPTCRVSREHLRTGPLPAGPLLLISVMLLLLLLALV